ncbi:MAG: hypothetical protein IT429_04830 [Gemmataceae bacterium]|nr:hypothetical protein [Gemmataceae bacterium]
MNLFRVVGTALGLGCAAVALSGCNRQTAVVAPAATAPVQSPPVVSTQTVARAGPQKPAPKKDVPPVATADRGTALVEELLRPSEQEFLDETRKGKGPRRLPGMAVLEQPAVPLPALPSTLPRLLESSTGQGTRPGAIPEESPLARDRSVPTLPQRVALPADPPVRLPTRDISQPAPLPILATPQPDRFPLIGPAPEVSAAATLAQPIPVRTEPAPFVRLNLPDPFEHAQTARLRQPVQEEPTPPVTVPRLPAR